MIVYSGLLYYKNIALYDYIKKEDISINFPIYLNKNNNKCISFLCKI